MAINFSVGKRGGGGQFRYLNCEVNPQKTEATCTSPNDTRDRETLPVRENAAAGTATIGSTTVGDGDSLIFQDTERYTIEDVTAHLDQQKSLANRTRELKGHGIYRLLISATYQNPYRMEGGEEIDREIVRFEGRDPESAAQQLTEWLDLREGNISSVTYYAVRDGSPAPLALSLPSAYSLDSFETAINAPQAFVLMDSRGHFSFHNSIASLEGALTSGGNADTIIHLTNTASGTQTPRVYEGSPQALTVIAADIRQQQERYSLVTEQTKKTIEGSKIAW